MDTKLDEAIEIIKKADWTEPLDYVGIPVKTLIEAAQAYSEMQKEDEKNTCPLCGKRCGFWTRTTGSDGNEIYTNLMICPCGFRKEWAASVEEKPDTVTLTRESCEKIKSLLKNIRYPLEATLDEDVSLTFDIQEILKILSDAENKAGGDI